MHAVYAVGTEKRPLLEVLEPRKHKGGFFSSLVPAFTSQPTPQGLNLRLRRYPHNLPKIRQSYMRRACDVVNTTERLRRAR